MSARLRATPGKYDQGSKIALFRIPLTDDNVTFPRNYPTPDMLLKARKDHVAEVERRKNIPPPVLDMLVDDVEKAEVEKPKSPM